MTQHQILTHEAVAVLHTLLADIISCDDLAELISIVMPTNLSGSIETQRDQRDEAIRADATLGPAVRAAIVSQRNRALAQVAIRRSEREAAKLMRDADNHAKVASFPT